MFLLSKIFKKMCLDPTVRDCSSEALGTLMKLVGEKTIGPFIAELEKDNLKMTKIRECCEKAVITVKVPSVKKDKPASMAKANAPPPSEKPVVKTNKRPTTGKFIMGPYKIFR